MPDYRKVYSFREVTRSDEGLAMETPIVKAAVMAVFDNPYAGTPYSEDLSLIGDHAYEIGEFLSASALELLGAPAQSYGKASLIGLDGAIEHGVAAKSAEFGTAVRDVTGGAAWLPSVVKRAVPGTAVDVPLAAMPDVWVRSHYDTITVLAADAPLPHELAIVFALSSGARPHPRLGGLAYADAVVAASSR